MALVYPKLSRFRTRRFVWGARDYLTREQEAPVYEWVSRIIESTEALSC